MRTSGAGSAVDLVWRVFGCAGQDERLDIKFVDNAKSRDSVLDANRPALRCERQQGRTRRRQLLERTLGRFPRRLQYASDHRIRISLCVCREGIR